MAGGRRIAVPAGGTRPTTDRVRESLFNVLTAKLDFTGLDVLDLYAGSGALGLEALSRGAASAVLVEVDRRAAAMITQNISTLGLPGASVQPTTVTTMLTASSANPVDLVFADPPYDVANTEVEAMLTLITEKGWATTGTIVVVERAAAGPALTWPPGWDQWRVRRYGDTRIEMAESTRADA